MRTHLGYRLSSHVTLALSCVCLVHSELFFMPELQFALVPLLALVIVACFVDGRWLLPVWAANLCGLAIAAGSAWWMAFQLGQVENPLQDVPLPAALVPHFGPVLMALMLVLLFRPRSPRHFWLVQGIGLLQVGLACVLATGSLFGGLLAAYLASGLGCLLLHHLYGAATSTTSTPQLSHGLGSLRFSFWLVRWTVGVGLAGLVLFLVTPRLDGPWDPHNNFTNLNPDEPRQAKTGLSDEINLNRSGKLELDEEVAFTVTATYARGQAKTDLPSDQRWRGFVLEHYDSGRWSYTNRLPGHGAGLTIVPNFSLDLWPGQFYLTYNLSPQETGGFVLADPVRIGSNGRVPIYMPGQNRQQVLYFDTFDAVLANLYVEGLDYRYIQVVPPPGPNDGRRMADNRTNHFSLLVNQYPLGLERWSLQLLRRLTADPRFGLEGLEIPPDDQIPGERLRPQTRDWERISRAFEQYLARSGEYNYSLELRHKDAKLDPVLDFLLNVKQGHCECYATALALMLRSQGIPAQVVKGYRGAESQGNGDYIVRHRDAHSWVEAMVESRPGRFEWLTLDPTPETEAPAPPHFSLVRWLEDRLQGGKEVWKVLILNYDAESQENVWYALTSREGLIILAGTSGTLLAVTTFVLLLRLRWLPRRPKRLATAASFYGRMVALLTRYASLRPQPAQTPREYSQEARAVLRRRPAAATLSDLPERVAVLFYRVRFGGRPLSDAEAIAVDAELVQLAAALRK